MKILGYELSRVKNIIQSPMIEKTGQFTIQLSSANRRARDINDLIAAINKAESTYNPLRYVLYNIYQENIDVVAQVRALINIRHARLLQREMQYIKKSGKVDEPMTEWLQSPKFKKFLTDILDTQFWGFSLFDFTTYAGDEWFNYDMVNRKHVDPIRKQVLKFEYSIDGTPYNDKARDKYVMPVGEDRDLGLLKNISFIAIHLRNLTSDMMNYVELAGNNFTIIKTKNNDPRLNTQAMEAMRNMGSSGQLQLPDGLADVQMESLSSSQQNQLFTSIFDLLNKELSKLILGSTMGVDDGSSRSQAEVHERTMLNIFESDAQYILDVLNYQFADKLPLFGKNAKGRFNFDENHTAEDMTEISKDKELMAMGLNFTPDYLAKKYGVPPDAIKKETNENNEPNETEENDPAENQQD